ncbi:unnamed protein product [Paramecium octaurelia]|uniref:Uncharacterized protein n=1 Tax=Paramecium octaurelia TaxID=43137 RepID=A0A8S1U2A7_PAROT|nr:unnamed protein product [Paramecium octaurelia]
MEYSQWIINRIVQIIISQGQWLRCSYLIRLQQDMKGVGITIWIINNAQKYCLIGKHLKENLSLRKAHLVITFWLEIGYWREFSQAENSFVAGPESKLRRRKK